MLTQAHSSTTAAHPQALLSKAMMREMFVPVCILVCFSTCQGLARGEPCSKRRQQNEFQFPIRPYLKAEGHLLVIARLA